MRPHLTCTDCNKAAPETKTNHTLISIQHGWRLIRERTVSGAIEQIWRCPPCWERYKVMRGGKVASTLERDPAKDDDHAESVFSQEHAPLGNPKLRS